MLANRVKETATTTGTGNFTLAGAATNHITFNTAFGTDRRFFYTIIDDTNNDWEIGIGYLSASTTLVRETVLNSTNSDAVVSFGSGTKDVINSATQDTVYRGEGLPTEANKIITGHGAFNAGYGSFSANTLYAMPVNLPFAVYGISTLGSRNSVAGAASTLYRAGIYSDKNGYPDKLLTETTGTFAADATADTDTEAACTSIDLLPGRYWFALVSDGTPDPYRAGDPSFGNIIGVANSRQGLGWLGISHTFGALPDPFGTPTSSSTHHILVYAE